MVPTAVENCTVTDTATPVPGGRRQVTCVKSGDRVAFRHSLDGSKGPTKMRYHTNNNMNTYVHWV